MRRIVLICLLVAVSSFSFANTSKYLVSLLAGYDNNALPGSLYGKVIATNYQSHATLSSDSDFAVGLVANYKIWSRPHYGMYVGALGQYLLPAEKQFNGVLSGGVALKGESSLSYWVGGLLASGFYQWHHWTFMAGVGPALVYNGYRSKVTLPQGVLNNQHHAKTSMAAVFMAQIVRRVGPHFSVGAGAEYITGKKVNVKNRQPSSPIAVQDYIHLSRNPSLQYYFLSFNFDF